jgi:sec-independent protein translocase protein TatB
MFDISSWKLIILAAMALIVVGPKDLPVLLRAVGKYLGIIKRQAAEFRAQFDEAMRDSELSELRKEVESLGREAQSTIEEAGRAVETEVRSIESDIDRTVSATDTEATEPTSSTALATDGPADGVNGSEAATPLAAINGEAGSEPLATTVLPPKPAMPIADRTVTQTAPGSGG